MMEVHDCFSITELVTMEEPAHLRTGQGSERHHDGFYDLDGKLPCQPDGGLKCFGHPIGASGLRMLYEMYNKSWAGPETGRSRIRSSGSPTFRRVPHDEPCAASPSSASTGRDLLMKGGMYG
jgi:acetyl-CoA acetyltransferase